MLRQIFMAAGFAAISNIAFAFDLTVSAGAQNAVISGSYEYTLPQGTQTVYLVYKVYSAEYPYYVQAQSIYNDVWSLTVSGASGVLFDITRQVNSQLTQPPVWLPDSTTGDIKQELNVSALTAAGEATVQISASAMNVGDSALPTIVYARLETAPALVIQDASPDTITTNNAGNYYSIPRPGVSNTLQRYFTLTLSKEKGVTVERVTVDLLNGNSELMTVQDGVSVPSGSDVTILSQTDTSVKLKVRVTMRDPASSVDSVPPPTTEIAYRFKVEGMDAEGNAVEDSKTITGRRGLWKKPDYFDSYRYGMADQGGDHWVARGTYLWMEENLALLREVDDISGEHGRNIGHASHQYGTDIDMYHFYRFPGATTGTSNYNLLQADVIAAFGTLQANPTEAAIQARDRVAAWVEATREGLTSLADLNTVNRLYYAIGTAAQGLPNGWARSLITTGRVSRTLGGVTSTLNLNLGDWTNGKVTYNSVHNTHVHITLDRPAIGE